LNKQTDTSWPW